MASMVYDVLNTATKRAWKPGVTPHLHVQVHPQAVVEVADDVADSVATVVAKGPGEAKDNPSDAHDAHRYHAHHHRVDNVGVTHQTAIEETQPRRHQKDQGCGGQDPCHCASVHSIFTERRISHGFDDGLGSLAVRPSH